MYYKAELNKSTPSSHTGFGQLYVWKLHVLCLKGACWVVQGMWTTQQTHPGTSTAFTWVVLPLRDGSPHWICYRDISATICFAAEISKKPNVALFLQLSILFFQPDLGTPWEQWLPWEQSRQEPESTGNSLRDNMTISGALCVPQENRDGSELENGMRVRKGAGEGKIQSGQTGLTDNGCSDRVRNSRNLEMGNSIRGKWSKVGWGWLRSTGRGILSEVQSERSWMSQEWWVLGPDASKASEQVNRRTLSLECHIAPDRVGEAVRSPLSAAAEGRGQQSCSHTISRTPGPNCPLPAGIQPKVCAYSNSEERLPSLSEHYPFG